MHYPMSFIIFLKKASLFLYATAMREYWINKFFDTATTIVGPYGTLPFNIFSEQGTENMNLTWSYDMRANFYWKKN